MGYVCVCACVRVCVMRGGGDSRSTVDMAKAVRAYAVSRLPQTNISYQPIRSNLV